MDYKCREHQLHHLGWRECAVRSKYCLWKELESLVWLAEISEAGRGGEGVKGVQCHCRGTLRAGMALRACWRLWMDQPM